jgi:hypothetical protein
MISLAWLAPGLTGTVVGLSLGYLLKYSQNSRKAPTMSGDRSNPKIDPSADASKVVDRISRKIDNILDQSDTVGTQVSVTKGELQEALKAAYALRPIWKNLRQEIDELMRQVQYVRSNLNDILPIPKPTTKSGLAGDAIQTRAPSTLVAEKPNLTSAVDKTAAADKASAPETAAPLDKANKQTPSDTPRFPIANTSSVQARLGVDAVDQILQKCYSKLIAKMEKEGNASAIAGTEGLRAWLTSEFPEIRATTLKERGSTWFLVVLYSSTGEGVVVPALDTPLGVGSELNQWFDLNVVELDTASRLQAKDILSPARVTNSARNAVDDQHWSIVEKGRLGVGRESIKRSTSLLSVAVILIVSIFSTGALAEGPTSRTVLPPSSSGRAAVVAKVYIDVSASMRGFVSRDSIDPSVHSQLLTHLKPLLVGVGAVTLLESPMAGEVLASRSVDSFEEFKDPTLYSGSETNIAGALQDATVKAPDSLAVILTDGVVSLSKARGVPGETGKSARDCSRGSDATCAALSVRDYVMSGHGFWIVGMRFPFFGPYYVEQGGSHSKTGTVIRDHAFPRRPFYVWVGSPSLTQGRQLVTSLVEFAKNEGLEKFAVEIAPGDWIGPSIPEDIVSQEVTPVDRAFCAAADLLGSSRPPTTSGSPLVISAHVQPTSIFHSQLANPELGFSVPIQSAFEEPPSGVVSLFTYKATIHATESDVGVSERTHDSGSRTAKQTDRPRLDICLRFSGHLSAERHGRVIHLVTRWSQAPGGDFWEPWSTGTDDTVKAAAETVNLDSFFRILNECFSSKDPKEFEEVPLITVNYQ